MRPHRAALAAALAGLVVLTGCQSDPEPRFADPTESVAPSSSTPTASPATTDAAPPSNPEGETAGEFIMRFQQESFDMQNTGDTSQFRRMYNTCQTCENLADAVDQVYQSGGSARAEGGQVTKLSKVGKDRGFELFTYTLQSRPSVVYKADGSIRTRYRGGSETFQINVRRFRGAWIVTDLVAT